ncbi:type III-B CRISPR module RAMP protein Cmr1 [Endozoicomonas euniceicola]|uniref:Type III-B CRISPR module RAMP protein Cmr1 n=1 Tax=Endozoicomonas euniceicola TaxID=1234143 RepID=A0ABY6GSX5_9GAMM|nr:type III-B CRISPR module RAMP protein Cmr1 [Endozoicomonas euniceicola]UYM15662.1 type III-B CRISPR module RAMP protein Cmr1 [Endozoicomonas euniceicola]
MIKNKRLPALEARYRISTPMFLGDASSDQCADKIRPPSVKGALRFWWRALAWGRLYTGDHNETLKDLHKEEGELLGYAAGGSDNKSENKGCQAAFRLRVHNDKSEKGREILTGIDYLLGQGITKRNEKMQYLASGGSFTVSCYPNQTMTETQHQQLEEALLCLGLFGGLGARSRKGLGSLSIQHLTGGSYSAPQNREEYCSLVARLLKNAELARAEPPYSAFSSLSRIDISSVGSDAFQLLLRLNDELQLYRSWGKDGRILGQEAERNFIEDHKWAYQIAKGRAPNSHPDRIAFGLPHNYYLSSATDSKKYVDVNLLKNQGQGRRASPLFSHVHCFANGDVILTQTLLQSLFLSGQQKLEVKCGSKKNKKTVCHVSATVNWSVIRKFMDRFEQREVIYGE